MTDEDGEPMPIQICQKIIKLHAKNYSFILLPHSYEWYC